MAWRLYYCVPASEHHHIEKFLADKPAGCGDDRREFVASFMNWAIGLSQSLKQLKGTKATIRATLHDAYPELSASKFIDMLEIYGKTYRHHKEFHNGIIKDPHSDAECEIAGKQLFACLHSRDERAVFNAEHGPHYPLVPVESNPKASNWEHRAATRQESTTGVPLRTIEGGDSNMADAMDGLGMSGDREEAAARAIARATTDYMVDNDMW
ncbi:hypothetical protein LTR10_005012 [Elasticomyces elasticus]|nr:hypothetical protein LTR10_005012 [Elasticomyces elasticus]KAK4975753.1 hypothetical protein LTR42_003374 [Elasticomyces elasticus]